MYVLKSVKALTLCTFLFLISVSECYIRDPGSTVIPTEGEIWPKPQVQDKSDEYLVVRPQYFNFQVGVENLNTTYLKTKQII